MIIKSIEIEKFRAFENVSFYLGRRITAIAGRNATQKTTVLGMIGQPFTISKGHPMYGCKTIDELTKIVIILWKALHVGNVIKNLR